MYLIHKKRASVDVEDIQRLSQITTLKARDYRVLFHLMGHLDGRTAKAISYKKIAKQLATSKEKIIKSIGRLIDAEVLVVESNEHVKDGFRLNF